MIFMIFGLPGSGKSYFASHLAKMMNAEYINSDRLRRKMLDKRIYSIEEKEMVYSEMLKQMREVIKENKDVVLDATFYKNDIRKKFICMDDVKTILIEVEAAEPLIRKRLQKLREDSEADFE